MAEFEKANSISTDVVAHAVCTCVRRGVSVAGHGAPRDIMRGLEPDFLHDTPSKHPKDLFGRARHGARLFSVISYDKMVESIRSRRTARSRMSHPHPVTVNHDDHIVKAMYEIVEYNVALIPVLEGRQRAGVVRSNDLFHEVAQLLL